MKFRLKKLFRDGRATFQMVFRLIRWDPQTLLLFEFLYRLLSLTILTPLIKMVLQWGIEQSGVLVLSQFNLLSVLRKPWCILLFLLLGLVMVFYEFIEITVIIRYFDAARRKEKITLWELLRRSWRQALRIGSPQNLCLLLFVALVIPLTNLTLASSLFSSLQIPEFVSEYVTSINTSHILYLVLMVLAAVICFRWIFSIHEYTLRGKDFRKACLCSHLMVKRRMLRIIFVYFSWSLFLSVIGYILYFLFLFISILLIKAFCGAAYETSVFWSWYDLVGKWKAVLTDGIQVLARYAWISAAYYYIRQKKNPSITVPAMPAYVKRSRHGSVIRFGAIMALVGFCAYFSGVSGQWMQPTSVCAHRGSVKGFPENNLVSLKRLVSENVISVAEIDVQQLKDGTVILMHDSNFKRVAGKDRNVWDVDYEEALTYDVGSYCGEEWEGTKVSTLEEVLDYIHTIPWFQLVIEIKPNGHEEGLVEQVVEMIEEKDVTEQCILASMNYDVLKKSKELNPELTTQLITFIAYGKLYTLDAVDIYSVEASFVTPKLVSVLRTLKKPLYVWTVNQEEEIRKLKKMKVDSIVTDEAYQAEYILSAPGDDQWIHTWVRMLLNGSETENGTSFKGGKAIDISYSGV